MAFVSKLAKKILFWNYPRTSWQWDVLCVLILVFIFLTPKSWFASNAFQQGRGPLATVIVPIQLLGGQRDRAQIGERARQIAARPNATIGDVREVWDANGKITGYEVDIR